MKKQPLLFTLLLALVIITSCRANRKLTNMNTKQQETTLLYNNRWHLEELNGTSFVSQRKIPQLQFAPGSPGRISGNTGCNNFNGGFALTGTNSIQFSALAMTKMACIGENTEPAFIEMISRTNGWTIQDDVLMLFDGKKVLAKFKAANS